MYFTLSMKTIFESRRLYKKKVKQVLDYAFWPSLATVLWLFLIGFLWSWLVPDGEKGKPNRDEDNKGIVQYFSIMTSTVFLLLGIGFLLSGYFLYKDILIRSEDTAKFIKTKILMATWVLSIPFLIRFVYNLFGSIYHFDAEVMIPSIKNDDYVAPVVYFIFITLADIFPITSQLVSMLVVLDKYKVIYERKHSIKKRLSDAEDAPILDFEKPNDHTQVNPNSSRGILPPILPFPIVRTKVTPYTETSSNESSSDSEGFENVVHLGIFSQGHQKSPLVHFNRQNVSRHDRSNSQTITIKSIRY
jgi:hypothetical protein